MNKMNVAAGTTCIIGGCAVIVGCLVGSIELVTWSGFGIYFIGKGICAIRALEYLKKISEKRAV